MTRRFKKVVEKTTALREKFWPDLSADDLWNRKEYDGFTSIPRTMPLIMNIIDDLTKAKPASSTYFALWCKAFDEMYVSLQNAEELAFHAGFTGQRAVRTWQERMKDLADLGFIKVAAGPRGSMSHAAIRDFADLRETWFQRWSSYRPRKNAAPRNGVPTYAYVHEATHDLPHIRFSPLHRYRAHGQCVERIPWPIRPASAACEGHQGDRRWDACIILTW